MRTKHHAKKLAQQLTASGIPAVDLHGNLSQGARDRNLAHFSSGRANVLVATDVAARGVHVDGIELVVHVDPPAEHKAYLHRSGRTARAGSAGDVVTIVLPEQRRATTTLLRQANIDVQPQSVSASSPQVSNLRGDVAPYVTPKPLDPQATQRGGGGAGSRNRAGTGRPHNPKGPRRAAGASATGGSHTAGGSHAPSSGSRSSASPQSSGSRQSAASFSSGSRAGGTGRSYSSGGSGGQGGSGNGSSSGRSRSNRYGSGNASSNRSR